MRIRTTLTALLIATCLLMIATSQAFAAPRLGVIYGPFASATPDSGTCGNNWASDQFNRTFEIANTSQPDNVVENFRQASFVTIAGVSPGACENGPDNGNTVPAGVQGNFLGHEDIVVSGGHFGFGSCPADPNSPCDTTAGFVATVYGPSATFTIPSFRFNYVAQGCGPTWQNASADQGGNVGDITC